jgi:osmotically inducible protein OsmC
MPSFARHVDVDWEGSVMEGKGTAKAGTGAFSLPVTFPSRVGEPEGKTSPEELIAAAHAACYAMALNATLGRKNAKARRTRVTATVTAERSEAGLKIGSSHLKVTVEGLEGMDPAQFAETAREAEGKCPVSNALRNNLKIDVEPNVAS